MTIANENVLLIGVDPDKHNILAALFRTNDYPVHHVQTVKEALSVLQQQAFCGVAF
jgi:CheY-like chemotaxis protein